MCVLNLLISGNDSSFVRNSDISLMLAALKLPGPGCCHAVECSTYVLLVEPSNRWLWGGNRHTIARVRSTRAYGWMSGWGKWGVGRCEPHGN